ncbi:putative alpha-ketoglutarate-dependent dioxygenase ABH6 [Russula decolorans]
MNLAEQHVPGSNNTYYIPDFVTTDEETYLLRKILETPQPKWKQLSNRRLQTWGGDLTAKNVLVAQSLPHFVCNYPDLISRIASTGAFDASPHQRPNHVILNEYLPGQGIMPHQDGPAYHPVVATLSLGSHTVMHYYDLSTSGDVREPKLSLFLEPRSLVITAQEQYTECAHGIDAVSDDRVARGDRELANAGMLGNGGGGGASSLLAEGGVLSRQTRYSLTCRDVARVMNVNIGTRK